MVLGCWLLDIRAGEGRSATGGRGSLCNCILFLQVVNRTNKNVGDKTKWSCAGGYYELSIVSPLRRTQGLVFVFSFRVKTRTGHRPGVD